MGSVKASQFIINRPQRIAWLRGPRMSASEAVVLSMEVMKFLFGEQLLKSYGGSFSVADSDQCPLPADKPTDWRYNRKYDYWTLKKNRPLPIREAEPMHCANIDGTNYEDMLACERRGDVFRWHGFGARPRQARRKRRRVVPRLVVN